jgi:hypothetical protein
VALNRYSNARSWRGEGSIWANRFLRSLAGQWGTSGEPTVLRSLGQFVPLTAPRPQGRPDPIIDDQDDQDDRLLAWARPGQLSYGEAELLSALDDSTPWRETAG